MNTTDQQQLQQKLLSLIRYPWKKRSSWGRFALSWLIGISALFLTDVSKYDWRFKVRGPQPLQTDIRLLLISPDEWRNHHRDLGPMEGSQSYDSSYTDNFFWNEKTWAHLFIKLLRHDPKGLGISFFFGDNIRPLVFQSDVENFVHLPDVLWAANLDNSGRVLLPRFSNAQLSNIGITEIKFDDDGIVRRFGSPLVHIPHFSYSLAQMAGYRDIVERNALAQSTPTINYRGGSGHFPWYGFEEIMNDSIPPSEIRNKVIIIGARDVANHIHLTPVGPMTRSEIFANVLDQITQHRFIRKVDNFWSILILGGLVVLCSWLIQAYPLSVALFFLLWIGTTWSAAAAWIFDTYYLWLPVLAVIIQLVVTYFIFVSYQLMLNEKRTWQLEQEQKSLREVEQLKNNFISLISHDLKTPIAKIQAVVDRILVDRKDPRLAGDLQTMRNSSDELHRYIQSILQVLRAESKDFEITRDVHDLNDVCIEALQQLRPLARERSIQFEEDLEPLFSLEFDRRLVQEVIHNLIENAIKYSPDGGVITVTTREIHDRVQLTVKDSGPGIPASEQSLIWEKFYRSSRSPTGTKGSGLGLYLVKYFIELHEGSVFLWSEVGKGTQVGFYLPINPPSKESREA